MSENLKCPLFRKIRVDTLFPVKVRSSKPSLLRSPTPTPPPLYMYSSWRMLKVSFSIMEFIKSIPVFSELNLSNRDVLLHETNKKPDAAQNKSSFIDIVSLDL